MRNETADGRVTPRRNPLKLAALVLLALAVASLCLQSGVTTYGTPDFRTMYIHVANFRVQLFSGKAAGTGILCTWETLVSADAVVARQWGVAYREGKWEVLK